MMSVVLSLCQPQDVITHVPLTGFLEHVVIPYVLLREFLEHIRGFWFMSTLQGF